jgi:hypothetical protein
MKPTGMKNQTAKRAAVVILAWLSLAAVILVLWQAHFVNLIAKETSVTSLENRPQRLTPADAAKVAARLANNECERLYKKRPFAAGTARAVETEEGYRWGRLDVKGPGGYSAVVTLAKDGTHAKVEVYYSTDLLR